MTTDGGRRTGRIAIALLAVTLVLVAAGLAWSMRRAAPDTGEAVPPASESVGWSPDSGRVIVEVLNASGVRGLGRRATAYLRDRGFDVVLTANAPDTVVRDSSLVLDRIGIPSRAARVAEVLGHAVSETRPDSSRFVHVTVLLGRSWRPPADALYP